MAESIKDESIIDAQPDVVTQQTLTEVLNQSDLLAQNGSGLSMVARAIQSPNFTQDTIGWRLNSNGEAELNGNRTVSTNYELVFRARGVSFYVSNGNTPNGALSGVGGDICFNGPSGNVYRCTGTTNWTAL